MPILLTYIENTLAHIEVVEIEEYPGCMPSKPVFVDEASALAEIRAMFAASMSPAEADEVMDTLDIVYV